MYGWTGRILRIDLTKGDTAHEDLDPKVAKAYIGGRGLGIYFMSREVDPNCDPFGDDNKLILAAGPLTGTLAPTGARYMVTTKSPLTGALTCSNSGGYFPTELKRAGYDAIIIEGKASDPVYIWIKDSEVEIRPAKHLWGKTTHQTDNILRSETDPKAKTAVIGPAGEKRVLFASIMNDRDRAAGRSGVGAVLGSKNLKGIVVRGTGDIQLADENMFKEVNNKYRSRFKEATRNNPSPLRLHGTAITAVATQANGVFPTKNFQYGTFDGWESIYGETLTKKYLVRPKACFSCPIACGRLTKVPDGPFKGEGPEYETIYSLGSDCGVDNLAALTKANYLYNELGLDTISMGSAIACAMELFEKGYLSEKEVGMGLNWGDGEVLVRLTHQTGMREGFGDILAEGSLKMASRYGHPELAMVSKGQDFPGMIPVDVRPWGLHMPPHP